MIIDKIKSWIKGEKVWHKRDEWVDTGEGIFGWIIIEVHGESWDVVPVSINTYKHKDTGETGYVFSPIERADSPLRSCVGIKTVFEHPKNSFKNVYHDGEWIKGGPQE